MNVAIVGGGPSLRGVDLSGLKGRCAVIGVNRTAEILSWVDACVTIDTLTLLPKFGLGEAYKGPIIAGVPDDYGSPYAEKSCDRVPRRSDIIYWRRVDRCGLPVEDKTLHGGADSGYGALCYAWSMRPRRIVLFGCDMTFGQGHWYRQEETDCHSRHRLKEIIDRWRSSRQQLSNAGIEVINASPDSRIDWWPRVAPQEGMAASIC